MFSGANRILPKWNWGPSAYCVTSQAVGFVCLLVCLFVCCCCCCCCCCCLVYFFTLIVLSVFTYPLWVSVYSLLSHFPHLPTFSAFSLLSYLFFLRFILHLTSILFLPIQFLTRGMSPHFYQNCQSVLSEPVATHATTWRNLAVERGFTTITPSTSSLHTPLQGKINKAHHIFMLAHHNDYSENGSSQY